MRSTPLTASEKLDLASARICITERMRATEIETDRTTTRSADRRDQALAMASDSQILMGLLDLSQVKHLLERGGHAPVMTHQDQGGTLLSLGAQEEFKKGLSVVLIEC
jgi:hypothetical protein